MRITKEANERRNEILDAANELFMKKGYDKTSTNEILEKVGIARGTLYYHFKSKEEIMDAIIDRFNDEIIRRAENIAHDRTIPVLQRFIMVISAMKIDNGEGDHVIEELHKPQNALMHQKMNRALIKGITPVFNDIVSDGISEGIFNTPYGYECMEMTITYANIAFDSDLIDMNSQEGQKKMEALFFNVERMLGSKEGTITELIR